jgi:iron(III) transport system ATP-binding protein
MPLLALHDVTHAYGAQPVVSALSMHLLAGQIGCLLGASGCGKTTVLRLIAGFETPTRGEIRLQGQIVARPGASVPPERRRVGMVFQDYALFPHLDVGANIAFGLQELPATSRQARVDELLSLVGLQGRGHRFPHELSGGQQQRVALARALAPRPDLLLLDEPFSNLDVELRERLSVEVRQILKSTGTTAILVTHDQHEAFAVADVAGIMHEGRIEQWGTPYDLYHRPATRRVAEFVGQGVFVPGTLIGAQQVELELGRLAADAQASLAGQPDGAALDVLLRPDDVLHDDDSPIRAAVLGKTFRGADFLYTLQLPSGVQVLSLIPSHHDHPVGESIGIRLSAEHLVAFPRSTTFLQEPR